MATDIIVPSLGESITEAVIAKWLKKPGEAVDENEPVVELETEKVSVEIPAPAPGVLGAITAQEGSEVEVGATIGHIKAGSGKKTAPKTPAKPAPDVTSKPEENLPSRPNGTDETRISPSARKLAAESGRDAGSLSASGAHGHILREDVTRPVTRSPARLPAAALKPAGPRQSDERGERVIRMTRLRASIARRLKQAQEEAAMLTTFNEVDMTPTINLRSEYRDLFEQKHGIRLGFMSFFAKAAAKALREIPTINAEIHGDTIIYKDYYDIGVAVGSKQGLVVPVIRDVDKMNFAGIETSIRDFGVRAREGKLTMQDMSGGTFTITNGGVFGSLLSTPIINPPQSAILGMHKIQKRPVVENDEIVIRDVMYVALSYDHRIVDGREAVTFLVRIKEMIEEPSRLLLDV